MNHYEIIIMVHPDQSSKILSIIDQYISIINNNDGKIHRLENWGRRQLSYPINNLKKAHYVLLNIEVSKSTILEISKNFKNNDAIIRSIVLNVKRSINTPSPMMDDKNEKEN